VITAASLPLARYARPMTPPVRLTHFSDILCVWAYAGQVRMDELAQEFGDRVEVEYRLTPVFGVARDKLAERWKDKDGLAGYARHVRDIVAGFPHVKLHDDTWARVAPLSSTPGHLVLAAIRALEAAGRAPRGAYAAAAWRMREAFFRDARDTSRREVLLEIVGEAALDVAALQDMLASGAAHAALARDDLQARELDIRVSPTIVMNDGRQRLNGNVGYRVIAANLRELLERPAVQHSWC
jgi:predicted DsbA family dithiol-disulfide isomerase